MPSWTGRERRRLTQQALKAWQRAGRPAKRGHECAPVLGIEPKVLPIGQGFVDRCFSALLNANWHIDG